jgi:hypothetical protein
MTEAKSDSPQRAARSRKPERPYLWANKRALKAIAENPTNKNVANTLLVYFGLCWLASDEETETFQAVKQYLANRLGVSKRTVAGALLDLEKLGVVVTHRKRLEGSKENDVNTYTLCSYCTTGHAKNGRPRVHKGDARKEANNLHGNRSRTLKGPTDEEINRSAPACASAALPHGSGTPQGAPEGPSAKDSVVGGDW